MFLGHLAVGFASKAAAPRASLGMLMAAPILLDLLWPLFLLAGWEEVRIVPGITAVTPLDFVKYPYSHSLVAAGLWAALVALLVGYRARSGRVAAVVAAGVVSHWILDWVSHRPDMPLLPGGPRYGLGLWNSVPATLTVEMALFSGGLLVYLRATRASSRAGTISLFSFVGLLVAIYVVNIFGAPPPNTTALAAMALSAWILPFWAASFDRRRAAAGAGV